MSDEQTVPGAGQDGPAAPAEADILIEHAVVMTVDGERRIYADGSIVIVADRIAAVGRAADVAQAYPRARKTIDGRDKLAMPGLINGHRHFLSTPKGCVPDGFVTRTLLKDWVYPVFAEHKEDDIYWAGLWVQTEMLKNGVTCFQEPGTTYLPAAVEAVERMGMRCSIGPWTWDQLGPDGAKCPDYFEKLDTDACIRQMEDAILAHNGKADGRIKAFATIEGVGTCSDELMIQAKTLAEKHDTMLVMHKATSQQEVDIELEAFGHRPVEHMYRIGALGPNVYLNHMVCVDDFEVPFLAETDTKVSHNPSSALKLAKGTTRTGKFPEMLKAGVTVCLGCDSANSSNFSDMVRVMYLAALLPRDARLDPAATVPEQAVEMATINGAKAFGWDDQIGSLEPGKKADITIFDTRQVNWRPLWNVVNNLVYAATGDSADTVIVDGRVLMEGRKLLTVDEDELREKAQFMSGRLLDRLGLQVQSRWPIIV